MFFNNIKIPKWMTVTPKIKQGIPQPKLTHEQLHPEEYETYVDPDCGCTKTRKKIKKVEQEIIETEEIIEKPKRGRKARK